LITVVVIIPVIGRDVPRRRARATWKVGLRTKIETRERSGAIEHVLVVASISAHGPIMDIDRLKLVGFAEGMPIVARAAHIPARAIESFDIASTEFTNGDIAEVPKRAVLIIRFIRVEVIASRAIAAEGDCLGSPVCVLVVEGERSNIYARSDTRGSDSEITIGVKIGIA